MTPDQTKALTGIAAETETVLRRIEDQKTELAAALAVGQRVERVGSPATTLVKDGARGVVVETLQAANGELAAFVRFDGREGAPVFCAASRLKPIN
jgi:hypothetical protein